MFSVNSMGPRQYYCDMERGGDFELQNMLVAGDEPRTGKQM